MLYGTLPRCQQATIPASWTIFIRTLLRRFRPLGRDLLMRLDKEFATQSLVGSRRALLRVAIRRCSWDSSHRGPRAPLPRRPVARIQLVAWRSQGSQYPVTTRTMPDAHPLYAHPERLLPRRSSRSTRTSLLPPTRSLRRAPGACSSVLYVAQYATDREYAPGRPSSCPHGIPRHTLSMRSPPGRGDDGAALRTHAADENDRFNGERRVA